MSSRGGKRKSVTLQSTNLGAKTPAQRAAETRRRNAAAQEQADRELVEETGLSYVSSLQRDANWPVSSPNTLCKAEGSRGSG